MHMGMCFKSATDTGAYPVVCYELQTNWKAEPTQATAATQAAPMEIEE